ncbi:response regulator transcription factor [Oleiagrimonas sp. C23AA]|uniref:response regulator transcription factor n=1 Tax=Oleiagrimonas sp. C23AA TaxID=2719047 RepID=UPI0019803EDD|nr:response regulator transcription factor [Oleiagrimonas sp. C23AA]
MRVLIVEDDAETREWVATGLHEEGYNTRAVGTGRHGLTAAIGESFDALIVDRRLPGLDGIGLVRAARAAGVRAPIIMLTALSDTSQRIEGLDAGADDYLGKPFSLAELLARLRAVARRPALADVQTCFEAGPLRLDLVRHEASLDGDVLDLTPTEYRLLEVLMRHAGRVVTRSMLLEQVWHFNFNPRTGVVETHMSRLRSKVRRGASESLIETVRGYGYRLR